ncbi:MAG: TonB-dependent receptor [Acidipila sp.]|nr:TonB-dependent receptor [Acidipila sp.]
MKNKAAWLLILAVLFGGRVPAMAQGGATGGMVVTVVDSSGGAVAGAEVQVIDSRTGLATRTLTTGGDGTFTAQLLTPTKYVLLVHANGFAEAKVTDIEVRVTETTRVTVTLNPGAVTQKVEVSATVTTVDTTSAATGQAISSDTIRALPLATQNFQQLLTLSTGAASDLNSAAQLGRGDVRIEVNGQREDNNNYLIEGISATDYNVGELTNTPLPNPEVIQEFKVQTSLYDASQGRNGGGNINAILKSGTSQFHGSLYEFFRNEALNANEFFLNRAGQPRPVVRQNIYGGSLGGPIGPQAKLGYFFGNYQGTRQRSGLSPGTLISTTLPVLPATRDQASLIAAFFPGGLPAGVTQLDPVAVALLNVKSNQFGGASGGFLIPSGAGTVPGTTGPFTLSKPGKYSDDQFTANWDREFRGGNDKLSSRFFFTNFESLLPFGAGGLQASLGAPASPADLNFPLQLPVRSRFLNITETHLFSARMVNEFRFGFVRIDNKGLNDPIVKAADLGINRPTSNLTPDIYKFTLASSGFQIGPTPPADQQQVQNNLSFIDTVSWTLGKHSLRFGGEYTRVNLDKLFPQVFNGQLFFFSGALTDFQKLLIGAPDGSFGGGGVFTHKYRQNNSAVFAQDDYKIRHDLTLNLGLRVEFLGAIADNLHHIGNLDPALAQQGKYPYFYPKGVNSFNVAGLAGTTNDTTLDNTYATGLGPRIGLAYDVFGRGTTTIRAGYGIYYVREDVGAVDQLSFQAPILPIASLGGGPGSLANFFAGTLATNPNALPPAGVIDPGFVPVFSKFQNFPCAAPFPCAANYSGTSVVIFGLGVPRHYIVPNTQQWNLTVQRALPWKWVAEVGYVGTKGTHLRVTRDTLQSLQATPTNPIILTDNMGMPVPITINTTANAVARSRVQGLNGYNGFQLFDNAAYSHYHALQVTLARRWGGNYVQTAYTYGKSTDATSTGNTAFNSAFNDQTDLRFSRGLSDFDHRHRFVASYNYSLPLYQDATGLKGVFLRGWGFSGIVTAQSGTPFSIFDSNGGTAFLGATTSPITATLAPGKTYADGLTHGSVQSRVNGYVNFSAFAPLPVLTAAQGGDGSVTGFGTLGRNIYRGPFQQNWDFSVIKNFRVTERQSLRFTTDFFNIWNHANFANPASTDVQSPGNFGVITSTKGTPRLIQFSLRYAF